MKISTKFLGMVTICKVEKTTVYLLLSLVIQFSAIEIRLVFPQQSYDKLITITGKKLGCPCSLVCYWRFSTDIAQNQGKSAMFLAHACMRAR